jgi:hypothetical protein
MAGVIDEVVMRELAAKPRRHASSLWAQIFDLAKARERSLEECRDLVADVQEFAYELSKRRVHDAEMPRKVILVSRVNYFVGQVLNGGVHQYLHNTGYSYEFTADLIEAFRTVGAVEHADVMSEISAFVERGRAECNAIENDKLQALIDRLETEQLSAGKLNARYRSRRANRWSWGDRWSAPIHSCAHYIDGWTNLRYVPDDQYDAEIDRLAARIPDLAAREKAHQEARAWEKKAIENLMRGSKVYYTTFGIRTWNEKTVWCWNFTVMPGYAEGHRQAIFVDGEIIIFMGDTPEVIVHAPAPECVPGSTTSRNEPDQTPGSLNPNISIRILDD